MGKSDNYPLDATAGTAGGGMRMDEKCFDCKYFESTHEGAFGAIGEDICTCRICCQDENPCEEFEPKED